MKSIILLCLISLSSWAETNLEILKRLVRDEAYGHVVGVHESPTTRTSISAEYEFPELDLAPGEILYFKVPEDLSQRPLSQLAFSHRQKGRDPFPGRDPYPGLTSALIYTKDMPEDNLRYWAGPASGKLGAKFAEYRHSPEPDTLYEWPKIGHKGVASRTHTKDLIRPNVVRIQNIGTDTVYISKAYIEVIPKKADKEADYVFTPNSSFGDSETLVGRNYGGGQKLRGLFPNALRLSSRDHASQPNLPEGFSIEKNKLLIELPKNKKFGAVDIMCGDTHPDQIINKDRGWGSLGNAKVTITIENQLTGEKRILLKDKNVGPEGVITASDIDASVTLKAGDRLVIENKLNTSTLYIMALRLGINHAK